jgi:hypothetical protein
MRSPTENNVRCPKKKSGEMGKVKQHYFDSLLEQAESATSMVPADFIPSVKTWTFGTSTGGEGSVKTFQLSCGGMELHCNIQGCISPFEPSSMDGAARKTLVLRLPVPWDSPLGEMEESLIKEVAARSKALFGEQQSEDELRARYKYITKKTEEYPRNLRVKLNTEGYYATRFWDLERQKVAAPVEYVGLMFSAVVRFRAVWIGAESWGLVCDATDLQVLGDAQPSAECPF